MKTQIATIGFYFARFWRHARFHAVLMVILSLLTSLLQGGGLLMILPFLQILGVIETGANLPAFVQTIVDAWRASPIPFTMPWALGGYTLLVSAIALLRFWQLVLESRLSNSFCARLQTDLFAKIIGAPWTYLTSTRRGDLYQNLQSDTNHIRSVIQQAIQAVGVVVVAVIFIVVALQLSVLLTVISVGGGGAIVLILLPLRRRIEAGAYNVRGTFREIFRQFDERLSMIKLVKSFGRDRKENEEYAKLAEEASDLSHRVSTIHGIAPLAYAILGAVLLSIFILIGVLVLRVEPARVLILIVVFSRLLPLVARLQGIRNHIAGSWPSLKSVREREMELDRLHRDVAPTADTKPMALKNEIRLRDVSFTYPGKDAPAVSRLNVNIHAGQITALAGPSGAGKTTLADLVLGLLRPGAGEITIDGVVLDEETLANWRVSTAYMPQEQLLMHDSIRANLIWAKPDATDEELWAALKRAAADQFVQQLPDGLDSVVGDRGTKLSGGERQRISLARALLHSPALLVLDEPTSALDDENEAVIRNALALIKQESTVLLIAHRRSTLEMADAVIRLPEGSFKWA